MRGRVVKQKQSNSKAKKQKNNNRKKVVVSTGVIFTVAPAEGALHLIG